MVLRVLLSSTWSLLLRWRKLSIILVPNRSVLLHLLAALGILTRHHVALHALHIWQQVEVIVHLVLGVLHTNAYKLVKFIWLDASKNGLREIICDSKFYAIKRFQPHFKNSTYLKHEQALMLHADEIILS